MNTLDDYLGVTFYPLFILGMTRVYLVLDSIPKSGDKIVEAALNPDFHIPLICSIVTLVIAVLAHGTNRKYVSSHPTTRLRSAVALLTFASTACIMLMYLFAVNLQVFSWWLGSYALLCIVNALWNYYAVPETEQWPHVLVNAGLGLLVFLFLIFLLPLLKYPLTIYILFLIMVVAKGWQRILHPRFESKYQ